MVLLHLVIKDRTMNNKRYLAIDWGKKKVGLAISDPFNTYAVPIKPIDNNKDLIKKLIDVFLEYRINEIVIGYPVLSNGEESSLCKIVFKFSEELSRIIKDKNLKIKVTFQNEFYSTKNAKSNVSQSEFQKKNWKNYKDSYSAKYILEDYLNNNNEKQ